MSYCVYTAATIELEQLEDPDEDDNGNTHERLAVILKMLESEARQTPGLKRSIEIIKARLEGGKRIVARASAGVGMSASPNAGHDGGLKSQAIKDLDAATGHMGLAFSTEGGSSIVSDSPLTSHLAFQSEDMGQGGSLPQTSQQSSQDGLVDMLPAAAPGTTGDPANWMDWSGYNVSGGFVSDTSNWGFYDAAQELK
jgi:hypothetical protein